MFCVLCVSCCVCGRARFVLGIFSSPRFFQFCIVGSKFLFVCQGFCVHVCVLSRLAELRGREYALHGKVYQSQISKALFGTFSKPALPYFSAVGGGWNTVLHFVSVFSLFMKNVCMWHVCFPKKKNTSTHNQGVSHFLLKNNPTHQQLKRKWPSCIWACLFP